MSKARPTCSITRGTDRWPLTVIFLESSGPIRSLLPLARGLLSMPSRILSQFLTSATGKKKARRSLMADLHPTSVLTAFICRGHPQTGAIFRLLHFPICMFAPNVAGCSISVRILIWRPISATEPAARNATGLHIPPGLSQCVKMAIWMTSRGAGGFTKAAKVATGISGFIPPATPQRLPI